MDEKTKAWIKECLANFEVSSDEELADYFIKECGLTPEETARWIALRPQYMREVFCDAEPEGEPEPIHILPIFMGYTIDIRLKEFRKANPDEALEFIPFDSPKGEKLLAEFAEFSNKLLSVKH